MDKLKQLKLATEEQLQLRFQLRKEIGNTKTDVELRRELHLLNVQVQILEKEVEEQLHQEEIKKGMK
jgi:glycerol-3-phosphate dehydrogenase